MSRHFEQARAEAFRAENQELRGLAARAILLLRNNYDRPWCDEMKALEDIAGRLNLQIYESYEENERIYSIKREGWWGKGQLDKDDRIG